MISIIIPTYNTGRYLPNALESVFAQTYSDYEVIVVDDGSTDNTAQVLLPYLEQITYIKQVNQGVSAARNRGIAAANGEWLLFLDADDKLMPHKLERQLQADAAILHSGWWLMAEDGHLLEEIKPYEFAPKLDLETWVFWKPIFPAAMIFKREWVERVGGFDESLHHAEDVDLVLRIAAAGGDAVWLKEATVYYRQRETSASHHSIKQAEGIMRVLDKFFALPNLPAQLRRREIHARYYTMLWFICKIIADGHLAIAKDYLIRAKNLINRPDALLLLEWQKHCDALDLFTAVLDLPLSATTILSGDYAEFPPMQQAELVHYYIAVHQPHLDIFKKLTPEAKLSAHLTAYIWSYGRRHLLGVLKYSFQKNILKVYRLVLLSAYRWRNPQSGKK